MMKCAEIQNKITEFLESSLPEAVSHTIKEHLKTCETCAEKLEETKSFLQFLSAVETEVPSKKLRENFDKMLAKEITEGTSKVISLKQKTDFSLYARVAASVAIVIVAFLIGKYESKIKANFANTNIKGEEKMLALLDNESASKRILAVNSIEKSDKKDTKIIQALIDRLFFDKNTNVRLTAAEALFKFSSEEMVKVAFIKALETEKNTLIQIELIQILVKIQEKRAVEPMKKMLKNEQTPIYVKQQLQLSLVNLL